MAESTSKSTQFNCFSPPVMIATMVIEVSLAMYTVWRYKMTRLVQLAVITLITLATFQLAEFMVCTGKAGHVIGWSRFGFAAITLLPPLGLHLIHLIANKPGRRLVKTAYATMAAFVIFYLVFPEVFDSYQCTGNYVIFHLRSKVGGTYWVYYFGWIIISMTLAFKWLGEMSKPNKKIDREAQNTLRATQGMIIGWLIFIVPTALANVINPASRQGIPSIMCGFAVLFALILALYIVPNTAEPKT